MQNTFPQRVFKLLSEVTLVTLITAYITGRYLPFRIYNQQFFLPFVLSPIITIIAMFRFPNKSILYVFGVQEGLILGVVYKMHIIAECEEIFTRALVYTFVLFVILTNTKIDIEYNFSEVLNLNLYVLFVCGLIELFLPFSSFTHYVLGMFGLALFSSYLVYDMQYLQCYEPNEVLACLNLYMDLLNMFYEILKLLHACSKKKRND